jgi:hypothetical protein
MDNYPGLESIPCQSIQSTVPESGIIIQLAFQQRFQDVIWSSASFVSDRRSIPGQSQTSG